MQQLAAQDLQYLNLKFDDKGRKSICTYQAQEVGACRNGKNPVFQFELSWLHFLDENDLPKESKIEWTKAQNRRSSLMQRPTAAVFYFGVKSCKTNKLKIAKILKILDTSGTEITVE